MQWISVKDRLPPKDGKSYCAINKKGERGYLYWNRFSYCWVFLKKVGWSNRRGVTHWMPLPEPPNDPYEHFGMGRREFVNKEDAVEHFPEKPTSISH